MDAARRDAVNSALRKYRNRGFRIPKRPTFHDCVRDKNCPHKTRDILDKHGVAFPLYEDMTEKDINDALCL